MSFRSARIWAHLRSLHPSNWKRSLRTKGTLTKVQGRFRSEWRMVKRSSIQQIRPQYWIPFSVQSTTNLNTVFLTRQSGCWMLIQFFNQEMTRFQATVHCMGEYGWRVGDFGGQRHFQHCRWRTRVVSAPEIKFYAPPAVGDPEKTAYRASSTCISPWTNLGGYHAWNGKDL